MTTLITKFNRGTKKLWNKIALRAKMERARKRGPYQSPEKNMATAGTQYLEKGIKKEAAITMNNRTRIDVSAPEIEEAIAQLKEELGYKRHAKVVDIDKKFERKWNCRIVAEDSYGVRGHVYFPDEQHYTYFLLRFGKTEKQPLGEL